VRHRPWQVALSGDVATVRRSLDTHLPRILLVAPHV
jgi:hypothetical protein